MRVLFLSRWSGLFALTLLPILCLGQAVLAQGRIGSSPELGNLVGHLRNSGDQSRLGIGSSPAYSPDGHSRKGDLAGRSENSSAQQIALTSQEQATLRQGRVLLSGEEGNYTARVMANGSIETAWSVLTDYDNFSSFLPGVESSHLIESNGNQRTFEQVNVIRIFPITHRERIVISASETYPSKISFNQLDGDLKKLQGAWYVTGAGNQVMITHQVVVEPSSNRRIFYGIYKDNLQKTMAALKQEIERRSAQ